MCPTRTIGDTTALNNVTTSSIVLKRLDTDEDQSFELDVPVIPQILNLQVNIFFLFRCLEDAPSETVFIQRVKQNGQKVTTKHSGVGTRESIGPNLKAKAVVQATGT